MPRRHAELTRTRDTITVRLGGPIPSSGPTRAKRRDGSYFESPHVGVSPVNPSTPDSANRVELVLQQRPLDGTDLDWQDVKTLGSNTAKPQAWMLDLQANWRDAALLQSAADFTRSLQSPRPDRLPPSPQTLSLDVHRLQTALDGLGHVPASTLPPALLPWVSETFWQHSFEAPQPTRGMTARLALREFERYYGDIDGTEGQSRVDPYQHRLVHERMVYCEFFAL